MAQRYEQLKSFVEELEKDFVKFYDKGVDSAGTRIRKKMQELRRLAQEIRKEIQQIRQERKAQKAAS